MKRIEGNTYPVRHKLREMGAKWNGEDQHWFISEDKWEEANAMVANVPPKEGSKGKRRKAFHVKCPVCGTSFDANKQTGRPQTSEESQTNPFNE